MHASLATRSTVAVCIAAAVFTPWRAAGQSVQGRVYDAATSQPIASAVVRLVDPDGEDRATLAADSSGRYRLAAPGPGTYRVQVTNLGYEAFTSSPFEVADTAEVVTLDVAMQPSPLPIRGVEVSTDRVNQRLREFLGMSPGVLRQRPIRSATIQDYARRGSSLSEMIRYQQIPNLQILASRDGPCYQFRARGCLPVYLDGARLSRAPNSSLPLEMLSTVLIVLPNEMVAYPSGAVLLFTIGFMR